jgi:hypothetical protein
MKRAFAALCLAYMLSAMPSCAEAQELDLHLPPTASEAETAAIMRDLAVRVLPVYQESDRERYLRALSALQVVAGDYAAADATRQTLRDWRRTADPGRLADRSVGYDVYVHALSLAQSAHIPFARAFAQAFREVVGRLSDTDDYVLNDRFSNGPPVSAQRMQQLFTQTRPRDAVTLAQAVELIWNYFAFEAYRSYAPLVAPLIAEDDAKRYSTDDKLEIRTADGITLSAVMVRPRNASKPLPTLLEFTIEVSPRNAAKECAAHGYVGIVAYARGKYRSTGKAQPFAHDGEDARSVIRWITRQPWSDGQVGMYGDQYSGYAAWAAAKGMAPGLKAIAVGAATAPGIDSPRQGNIYFNSAYQWVRYVTDNRTLDSRIYDDAARWRSLNERWYRSGKPYWDLTHIYGSPNANFRRWLGHPSYDLYWQRMVPYRQDFAHIKIPVLAMSGYFDESEPASLYYFSQHQRFNPAADQTLLLGPYLDGAARYGAEAVVRGYALDSGALLDLHELRYQWFDAVLKGAPRPALLQDRVNFQVMGANQWRHASSIAAMANASMRLYLEGSGAVQPAHLATRPGAKLRFVQQEIDFAKRGDAESLAPVDLVGHSLPSTNALIFVSDPLPQAIEFDGLFSGRLDFRPNKMDLDLRLSLYEQLASGEYVALFDPPFELRASYAADRVHRHLLKAGERQQLQFQSERISARRLQPGSRLVLVLGVNKRPDQQIDYGTGQDVSDESLQDAAVPLRIRWYNGSYIDLPISR